MIDINYIEFFENYFEEENKISFTLLFNIFSPIILLMQQILNINI